ncbi:hypothetical protein D3C86_1705960 [compost metagenome]
MSHPFIHFTVQGLAGGDVGHLESGVGCQLFSQATFAGAGAAEDQLQHGSFLKIFGEATAAFASKPAPTFDRRLTLILCALEI